MERLIKMEFYQLIHNRLFYLMAGISAVCGGLMGPGYIGNTDPFGYAVADGLSVFGGMASDSTMLFLIFGGMGALMLGQNADGKTLGLALSAGHSRFSVYFSKTLVFLLAVNVVMFLFPFAGLVSTGLLLGFDNGVMAESIAVYLPRVTGMVFLANCAVFSVTVLFMALFQDTAKTTACTVLAILLEIMAMLFFLIRGFEPLWTPPYLPRAAVFSPVDIFQIVLILLIALGFTALLLAGGYVVFRRREIK